MEGSVRKRKTRRPAASVRARERLRSLLRCGLAACRRWQVGISRGLAKAMPPRDAVIAFTVAAVAFGLGISYGRIAAPKSPPGEFVTIRAVQPAEQGETPADGDGGVGTLAAPDMPAPDSDGGSISSDDASGLVGPLPAAAIAESTLTSPRLPSEQPMGAGSPSGQAARPGGAARVGDSSGVVVEEKMAMPVQGRIISEFGWRKHPVYADWRYHTGIDIGAQEGTPVKAALSGKVIEASAGREMGLYVLIEHRGGLRTKYGHLASCSVKSGDQVAQGHLIGKVGSSGVTLGSYLHFEVIRAGKAQDPRALL